MRYWTYQATRGSTSSDLTKIGWGNVLGALGMLCLVAASMISAGGDKPGVGWSIACFALFAWGFIYNWPITLALCSRVAPPAIGGVIMGVAFLTNFVSNYLSGWLGAFYEQNDTDQLLGHARRHLRRRRGVDADPLRAPKSHVEPTGELTAPIANVMRRPKFAASLPQSRPTPRAS